MTRPLRHVHRERLESSFSSRPRDRAVATPWQHPSRPGRPLRQNTAQFAGPGPLRTHLRQASQIEGLVDRMVRGSSSLLGRIGKSPALRGFFHAHSLLSRASADGLALVRQRLAVGGMVRGGHHADRAWSLARGLTQTALLPPAAFAVHELRYLLAFGGGAEAELQRTGHSYLHSLVPWLVLALSLVEAGFCERLDAPFRASDRRRATRCRSWGCGWCVRWPSSRSTCRRSLGGSVCHGASGGLGGNFGYGGWSSIPAAVCVGLVLAAVFHGARWVLDEVAERCSRAVPALSRPMALVLRPRDVLVPRLAPLAGGWSDGVLRREAVVRDVPLHGCCAPYRVSVSQALRS